MPSSEPARGIRNNDPVNIVRDGTKWQGLAPVQSDPRFCVFTSPQFGIRAAARNFLSYQREHGLKTVRELIGRHAPPVENNTDAYVAAVAKAVGVDPDQPIVLDDAAVMVPFLKAVIAQENGRQPYSDRVLLEGVRMAGVHNAIVPAVSARLISGVGGMAASGGAGVVMLASGADQVREAITPYADHSAVVGKVVAFLAVAGAALVALKLALDAIHHRATGA